MSKFTPANNKIDPTMKIFPEPRRVVSETELANQDAACFQDREFWKDGEQQGVFSVHSLAVVRNKSSLSEDSSSESDDSSQEEIKATMRALADERVSAPPPRNKNNRLRAVGRDRRLLDTAYEILASHAYDTSSSSNTVRAVRPLSSTDSTLQRKVRTAVAYDIPVGDKKTVCPPARIPRPFRKLKIAPEPTLDIKEKMRTAEERTLKELQRIRKCARSRAGVSRPHPAEISA